MQTSESYHNDRERMEERDQCHSRHFHCLRLQKMDPLKEHIGARQEHTGFIPEITGITHTY